MITFTIDDIENMMNAIDTIFTEATKQTVKKSDKSDKSDKPAKKAVSRSFTKRSTGDFPAVSDAKFKLDRWEVVKQPDGTEKRVARDVPVLETTVWFDDGTWTRVRNSNLDGIEFEQAVDPDTKEAIPNLYIANTAAKENAVVAAVFKRLMGKPSADDPTEWIGDGYGQQLAIFAKDPLHDADLGPIVESRRKERQRKERAEKAIKENDDKHRRRIHRIARRLADKSEAEILAKEILENRFKRYGKTSDAGKTGYVRPDKPFREFTQEEKREYWREQKRSK